MDDLHEQAKLATIAGEMPFPVYLDFLEDAGQGTPPPWVPDTWRLIFESGPKLRTQCCRTEPAPRRGHGTLYAGNQPACQLCHHRTATGPEYMFTVADGVNALLAMIDAPSSSAYWNETPEQRWMPLAALAWFVEEYCDGEQIVLPPNPQWDATTESKVYDPVPGLRHMALEGKWPRVFVPDTPVTVHRDDLPVPVERPTYQWWPSGGYMGRPTRNLWRSLLDAADAETKVIRAKDRAVVQSALDQLKAEWDEEE